MAKRTKRRSLLVVPRFSSWKRHIPTKARLCLLLFVSSIILSGGLLTWVRAPIRQAANPLLLQLYPMEYCLAEGLNGDTKNEQLESLRRDSWYFVPVYTSALLFLGLTIFCASGVEWIYGVVILVLAVFAAQCDLLENHHLEQCLDGDAAAAYAAYAWTRWKWATLSFVLAAAAPQLFTRQSWRRMLGFLLMIGGGLGTLALLPTEKIAPLLRHVLVPVFLLNLSLIWLTSLVDLTTRQEQGTKKQRQETGAPKPPRKKREKRKSQAEEVPQGDVAAQSQDREKKEA